MKKFILAFMICFACGHSFAQINANPNDTLPLYKQYPDIPPISITKAPDSTKFTKQDIKKKEPLVLIMFSPDCEHCQRETKNLLAKIDLFKDVQIVMATPLDYGDVKKFYDDYKLADYPNITVGRDPVWFLGNFFKVHNFPTIAVYDKHGKFVTLFEGSVPVEKIAAALKP